MFYGVAFLPACSNEASEKVKLRHYSHEAHLSEVEAASVEMGDANLTGPIGMKVCKLCDYNQVLDLQTNKTKNKPTSSQTRTNNQLK